MKKKIRLLVSVIVLGLLLYFTDISQLINNVRKFDLSVTIYFVLLLFFGVILSTFKWTSILNFLSKKKYSFKNALLLYIKSSFYNKFLPTSFGGDVYKVTRVKNTKLSTTVLSVFLDRLFGGMAVGLVFVATLPYSLNFFNFITAKQMIILYFLLLISLGILVLFHKLFFKIKYLKKLSKLPLSNWFFYLGISLLFFLISILIPVRIIFSSYNVELNFVVFACFIAIVYLSRIIPFTINGLGVVESVYVFLFGLANVESSLVLTVALSVRLLSFFTFLIFYLPIHFLSEKLEG